MAYLTVRRKSLKLSKTSIVIFAGAAESLTADSLNDLILAALGLDRGTYELELDGRG
ncbi:MAG: hypothetical protein ACLUFM_02485 [Lachnospiraceae bacterium]